MAQKKYKGVLAKKIKLSRPPVTSPALEFLRLKMKAENDEALQDHREKELRFLREEQSKKFAALCEHYDISSNDPNIRETLLLSLIEDHVPGFQFEIDDKAGRPNTWDEISLLELFYDVEKILSERNGVNKGSTKFTIERACDFLGKKEPWKSRIKSKRGSSDSRKTLQNKFANSKGSSLVQMYVQSKGTKSIQEDFILEILKELLKQREKKSQKSKTL